VEGVEALGLDRCVLGSLEGIERFKALRGLWIGDVKGLTDLRPIERATGLRSLSISTKHRELAEGVGGLDLSAFPDLRMVKLECWAGDLREPIAIDMSWVPSARWLRHLTLRGFAPAGGSYEDIMAASGLVNLTLTARRFKELEGVYRALPLTSLHWHDMAMYASSDTFGMFSAKGEKAVARMVRELTDWLTDTAGRPRIAQLNQRLAERMQAIDASGHHEIFDTDVRDSIAEALEEPMEDSGLDPDRLDFI
jgi:hypothetical protein